MYLSIFLISLLGTSSVAVPLAAERIVDRFTSEVPTIISSKAVRIEHPFATSNVPRSAPSLVPSTPSQSAALSTDNSPHSPPCHKHADTILASINKWRKKYKKPELTWDTNLASLARIRAQKNGGQRLVHTPKEELHYAQVIGPGMEDIEGPTVGLTPFEFAFVNGWLCEVSGDPELGGICGKTLNIGHMTFGGQTGHHDILLGDSMTKVGCGFSRKYGGKGIWAGQWICNLQTPGMAA